MDRPLLTAYHEAGHAIAVQMRGGTVTGLTIDPGLTMFTVPASHKSCSAMEFGSLTRNAVSRI